MKTPVRKGIGIIVFILLCFIGLAYILRIITGTHIQHYKQYVFPCEGRIITNLNGQAQVSLYVFDEQEISELSDSSNISNIELIDTTGNVHNASSWHIDTANLFQGSSFFSKVITCEVTADSEFVIEAMNIKYPDTTEHFFIGKLKIAPIIVDNTVAETQILSYPFSIDGSSYIDENVGRDHIPSMLYVSAKSFRDGFSIRAIDMGIDGLGVSPITIKIVEAGLDLGEKFKRNPENHKYMVSDAQDSLPLQNMDIPVNSYKEGPVNFIISILHDKNFNLNTAVKYYSPLYTCVDNKTGEEYIYGDNNYYFEMSPDIDSTLIEDLLEDFGI